MFKRILAFTLLVSACLVTPIFANTQVAESDVETYPFCADCSWFTLLVCASDGTVSDEYTHTYNFGKECKITILTSKSGDVCPSCSKVLTQYGSHRCWEVHNECGKGSLDVCPCDVTY